MGTVETDLQLAQRAVLTGAAVALPHFEALAELPREVKADGSVVTAADRAVETAIRAVLTAARPGDAILGEEEGQTGTAGRRWIIDPIDGTALFVAGDNRWLILIGLEEDGEIVAAVAAHPAQGSLWWATRGGGAFEGRVVGGRVVAETPVRVSAGADSVAGSRLGVVPEDWGRELVAPLKEVTPALPWPIHPGLMVARGDLDLAVQTGGQIWDFAATSLIVREAGGSFSSVDGRLQPGPGASVYARSDALRQAALTVVGDPAARATS
ncbi:inositol monophosphatase family protein [Actinoplanes sp. TRM 88003]|uniref:Inositol monophosphatase family protein n=1 Tax=Paractinoplanes aksuensis TaxID=2939490 RepID=A0ABT1DF27_9ACTN|nr:inositol monophosphatase family protein [Actinoplanes aksuensis]MCO8269420.1 inositol monophosphatase family protein [Actinoplanes aksuensis]